MRGVVDEGSVRAPPTDEQDLAGFGTLVDHHTPHDALPVANHLVRRTGPIVSGNAELAEESTAWE